MHIAPCGCQTWLNNDWWYSKMAPFVCKLTDGVSDCSSKGEHLSLPYILDYKATHQYRVSGHACNCRCPDAIRRRVISSPSPVQRHLAKGYACICICGWIIYANTTFILVDIYSGIDGGGQYRLLTTGNTRHCLGRWRTDSEQCLPRVPEGHNRIQEPVILL